MRQPIRLFGVPFIVHAGRIEIRIGKPIVDGAQPRGTRRAGKRDLHRRRLAGKDQQAISRGVQGQIYQNIDTVLAHGFRHALVRPGADVMPPIGALAELFGEGVRDREVGIERDLESLSIMGDPLLQNQATQGKKPLGSTPGAVRFMTL